MSESFISGDQGGVTLPSSHYMKYFVGSAEKPHRTHQTFEIHYRLFCGPFVPDRDDGPQAGR